MTKFVIVVLHSQSYAHFHSEICVHDNETLDLTKKTLSIYHCETVRVVGSVYFNGVITARFPIYAI